MNRRDFLLSVAAAVPTLGAAPALAEARAGAAGPHALGRSSRSRSRKPQRLFIGTYTDGTSEGIYHATFEAESGALNLHGSTSGIQNPSFLAIDPSGKYLFAVSETSEGEIVSYRIAVDSGGLEEITRKPAHGGAPCHLTVDRTGRYVLAANYSGGNIVLLPVTEDGALGDARSIIQHEGSSVHPDRQTGPHAHSVTVDPANRFVFAADLGLDEIRSYALDLESGKLRPSGGVAVAPGSGPRHFAFHPNGTQAFVINELSSTITAFAYDSEQGRLTETGTVTTLPADYDGENYCADIHVHPSGRYLYGSNRGHDSIAVFTIHEDGGLLPVQHQETGGAWPRNFALDPSGRFLLAANQRTHNVVVFSIDADTGVLDPTGTEIEVPSPVCVRFLV